MEYEYRMDTGSNVNIDEMNKIGKEGWELCTICTNVSPPVWIYKRKKSNYTDLLK